MLVDLDDICAYLMNVARNHTTRTTRAQHGAAGTSHEHVSFVLRRCVEELQAEYTAAPKRGLPQPSLQSVGDTDTVPNQTYRNRATQ